MKYNFALIWILMLGIFSCGESSEDCCILNDVEVSIHYLTQSGENLLNSNGDHEGSEIKIYYKNDDEYEYAFNGLLDYPNMHYIQDDGFENLILTVFPSNYYEGNQSTTLIKLNEMIVDTLVCEFDLSDNREVCIGAWLNGIEMDNRFISVVK